jgi:ribosomal protein L21E
MSKRRRKKSRSSAVAHRPQRPVVPRQSPPRKGGREDYEEQDVLWPDEEQSDDWPGGNPYDDPAVGPAQIASLLGLVASGGLDDHLSLLTTAIAQRRRHLAKAASIHALASVKVGDRVRINRSVRPLYLQGATGTVTGWSGQSVVVQLDVPVGRFTTGEVRCPPLGLEPIDAA